ncbi:MAG: guanylate kinase [Chloroflexota bacterium]
MTTLDPYTRVPQPLLIVISGPSGVGKDATIKRMKELGCPFYFVVTATTRPQRPGEVHGQDYFFVSTDEFVRMVQQDDLLEHALVYGEYKGIPKAQVRQALESGQDVILRLDVQGAATIRKLVPEAVLIFLSAASEDELVARLRARRTEPAAMLQRRLDTARQELRQMADFDYLVINRDGDLDETVEQIVAIITAEKCRVQPRCVWL